MSKKISVLIFSLAIFLVARGCVVWDSKEFEPTARESERGRELKVLDISDLVDQKRCRQLGVLKLIKAAEGQSPSVVAVRKYEKANLIKRTGSGMDGNFFGEAPTDSYDVYQCDL